jgi:hypothetical protein
MRSQIVLEDISKEIDKVIRLYYLHFSKNQLPVFPFLLKLEKFQ